MKRFDWKEGMDKLKDKLPVLEQFVRRHLAETFTAAALLVGAFSAWHGYFVGGTFITLLFFAIGAGMGIFLPDQVDGWMKKIFQALYKKNKASMAVVGSIKVVIALFVPFVFFGFFGLIAGSAYHYYSRKAQGDSN